MLSSRILSGWGDTMLSGRGPLLKKLFTPITAIPFVSCQHLAVRLPDDVVPCKSDKQGMTSPQYISGDKRATHKTTGPSF